MGTGLFEERANRGACAALDLPDAVLARFLPIATAAQEVAAFGYFDPEWRLLAMRHLPPRCVDAVTIPFRTIVADALASDCALVVMAHNHPSGDPTPSAADYRLTRRIAQALQFIDVALFDHLVIAAQGYRSFRARGLL
ncbi:JAB domain-containing protein [Sphingomonas sp. UYEF23]|uniref:JAB domain-containing protein n=1 Tax=Sphingomonas sp. UYEF23 TaxID=1756408 RepID=UPI003394BFC6